MGSLGSGSSSAVTVEFTDPFGTYPAISKDLSQLLPLRNLHWKSASRPLRSIKALHIELCPTVRQPPTLGSPPLTPGTVQVRDVAAPSASVPTLHDEVQYAPNDSDGESKKGRRHQIPGLRRTPYLKLFFLRCDDVDTYKATSRKLLREWVKGHTPPSQSSNGVNAQENHDAFEWLIVHVVASSGKTPDHVQDSTNSLRPSARSAFGVVDKIRLDFNGTSKSAVDRVAQIEARPNVLFTGPSVPTMLSSDTGLVQQGFGWDDLISKMKSLILASLDLRVTQYEEDIREKESQRNLPGWNFCTFFVLKEGLARGFESVGLIQDALLGYHELSVGLDALVEEHCKDEHSTENPSLFASYTEDLLEVILQVNLERQEDRKGSITRQSQGYTNLPTTVQDKRFGLSILNTDRKPFRELILANTISAFDFQCYVFARQIVLLLRLANIPFPSNPLAGKQPSQNSDFRPDYQVKDEAQASGPISTEDENLLVLGQACHQAILFITSAARMLRRDLQISIQKTFPQNLREAYGGVIETMVSSWKCSVCQVVLEHTNVPSLRLILQDSSPRSQGLFGNVAQRSRETQQSKLAAASRSDEHPVRRSSMVTGIPQSDIAFETGTSSNNVENPQKSTSHLITGLQELSAQRGELINLKRTALFTLGRRQGWIHTWAARLQGSQPIDVDEITLQKGNEQNLHASNRRNGDTKETGLSGILDPDLGASLQSRERYCKAYENLTALALQHNQLSTRLSIVQNTGADLAMARYEIGHFEAAAYLCHDLTRSYGSKGWDHLELTILQLQVRCLMSLGRDEEFVRVALRILAKLVASEALPESDQKRGKDRGSVTSSVYKTLSPEGSGYLGELLEASKNLKEPMIVPMANYFRNIQLLPYIRHHEHQDGYELTIEIRHVISEELPFQHLKVKILGNERTNGNEIWLTTTHAQVMRRGMNKVTISSQFMCPGWYSLDTVILHCENVTFTYEARKIDDHAVSASLSTALRASVSPHSFIHLEHPRAIEIEICPGQNAVRRGGLVMKAGSAGLRLRTADAEPIKGSANTLSKLHPGHIEFEDLCPNTPFRIKVPFNLEADLQEIMVKLEIRYTTHQGEFAFGCNSTVSVALPLGVNVQDVFKAQVLFSRFTISTANSVPLRVFMSQLEGNNDFDITSPSVTGTDLTVFPRQPLSLTVSVHKRLRTLGQDPKHKLQTKLLLHVYYECLDREICDAVETSFVMAIKHTSSAPFQHLLLPNLLALIRTRCSLSEVELVAILREIRLGAYEGDDWNPVLCAIEPRRRRDVEAWLASWYKEHELITIPERCDDGKPQHIVVPVQLPSLDVIHTVRLRILEKPSEGNKPFVAAVGKAIKAELSVRHSRVWKADGLSPPNADERLDFFYEVQASSDTWLIGGRKTAHFSVKEDETLTFPVILLPQRVGHLLFPTIEIRAIDAEKHTPEGFPQRRPSAAPISCEVDYRNQGETLQVHSGLQSTTVSLDPSHPASAACLIESRSW